ncbi:DNA topoisomerase 1 [Tilletia horrida]|nr:DNA topoisomerase 1 [Tilletia horrida]
MSNSKPPSVVSSAVATPMDIDEDDSAPLAAAPRANGKSQKSTLSSKAASPESTSASQPKASSAAAVSRGKQRLADSDDEDMQDISEQSKSHSKPESEDDDDDSDVPLSAKTSRSLRQVSAEDDENDEKDEDGDDEDEDGNDDEGNGGYDEDEGGDEDDDEDDAASTASKSSNLKLSSSIKRAAASTAKRLTGRSDKKWDTLYHKGPRFPPPYEPLPKHVKLKYDGKPVTLPPQSEEAAMFYAIKIETDYVKKPSNAKIFNKNFFDDWKKILSKHPPANGVKIEDFSRCDFRDMYAHFKELRDAENERKKGMAPSARKKEIEEKKAAEADFRVCVVDGLEQKVGNFTVEPPGLFLGRGAHPKMGKIKKRIRPEDITINHTINDPKHPPPSPPKGHKWAEIKFEKARKLDNHVRKLRAEYEQMLTSKSRSERELGTVVWLIDVWSLRVGNEKNAEEEAETYGACSLLKEHITCLPVANPATDPHWVKLSFLGKDSMKFEGQNVATPQIYKNLQMFSKGFKDVKGNTILKKNTDPLFVSVDPGRVNKFLTGHMAGLSAKVFRTYNASVTFQALLDRTDYWLASQPDEDRRVLNPANLKLAYEAANYQVAVLCNHQRTQNQQQLEQAENRTANKRFNILYERFKFRQLLLTGNKPADLKKAYKGHDFAKRWDEIFEEVPITTAQIKEHEENQAQARKDKLIKRYERDQLEEKYQAKLKSESEKKTQITTKKANGRAKSKKDLDDSEQEPESERDENGKKKFLSAEQRDEQLQAIDERLQVLVKERKSGKAESESGNIPGVCKRILGCVDKLKAVEAEADAKAKVSDVALGTSKLNYIDPRITVAWLKKYDLRLQEEALKDPNSKLSREAAKIKEEETAAKKAAKTAASKAKGKKGGRKAKKDESEDEEMEDEEEEVKPNGRKRSRAASEETTASNTPRKRVKGENGTPIAVKGGTSNDRTNLNAVGESDKMELDLKVLNLTHYFPNTMQKKFKWAATDDDGLDLRPTWQFVKDPWAKMRKPARKEGSKADNVDMWEAPSLKAKVEAAINGGKQLNLKTSLSEKMPSAATQAAVITGPSKGKVNGVRKTSTAAKAKKEDDSEDDDAPLVASSASRPRSGRASAANAANKVKASGALNSDDEDEDDDDDEEKPLAARKKGTATTSRRNAAAAAAKKLKDDDDESELSEDDDSPLSKK